MLFFLINSPIIIKRNLKYSLKEKNSRGEKKFHTTCDDVNKIDDTEDKLFIGGQKGTVQLFIETKKIVTK